MSPYGARLSMTTSATSLRRLPLGCLEVTWAVCSRLVIAMTPWPCSLAASAMPTIEPLTPEFEAMMKTSSGCGWIVSQRSSTMAGSRSRAAAPERIDGSLPPRSTTSRRAMLLVGMSPPARPAISIAKAWEWPVPNACTMPPASSARVIISTGASSPPASASAARRSSLVVTSSSSCRDESTIQKDPFREFEEDEQTKRAPRCQGAARICCREVTCGDPQTWKRRPSATWRSREDQSMSTWA